MEGNMDEDLTLAEITKIKVPNSVILLDNK